MIFIQTLLPTAWLTRTGFILTILLVAFIVFYGVKVLVITKGKAFFVILSSVWRSIKKAIAENPEIRKITRKHKKFFLFLQKRFNKESFFGLTLTLVSLALLYLLILFGGIVEDIVNSETIVSADIHIDNLLAVFRNASLTSFFIWITLLGKWQTILIFSAAVILILWNSRKQSFIIPLLVSITGSEFFTSIGKIVFQRTRPDVALYIEHSFSFPSGHATIALAFYGFLAYLLIRNSSKWTHKTNSFFVCFIIILLIGFSRLYLGVHYLSDIWGGYLVGAIWLVISISISEYLLTRKTSGKSYTGKWSINIASIVIAVGLYALFALQYTLPVSANFQETEIIPVINTTDIFATTQSRYTETLVGRRQEPLCIILVAQTDQDLIRLFNTAGWMLADNVNVFSLYKVAKAAIIKESYPQAPMTPDFWNSEVHNFGFEKETKDRNARTRHHARIWKTSFVTGDNKTIYVGTASFDSGIKWGITHKINPDIDTEREILFEDLLKTGMISRFRKEPFVEPQLGSNFSGDLFFTDGKIYTVFLEE